MPEARLKREITFRIESRDAMLLAGSQQHYTEQNSAEIPAQWNKLLFGKIPNQVGRTGYGIILNSAPSGSDFDYFAGVKVSTLEGVSSDFAHVSVPVRKYAIFPHCDYVSRMQNTIRAIFTDWYPTARGTVATPGPGEPQLIEFYGEDFDPHSGRGTMELWVPLKQ